MSTLFYKFKKKKKKPTAKLRLSGKKLKNKTGQQPSHVWKTAQIWPATLNLCHKDIGWNCHHAIPWREPGDKGLMAAVKHNKGNVCLVMDYHEHSGHDIFTSNANDCETKLWEWYQQGANIALLNWRKTSLQAHINESLLPYQTVMIKGKWYSLMQLRSGLKMVHLVMKSISTVLLQKKSLNRAVLAYSDDL